MWEILNSTTKRYQDTVLWAWSEISSSHRSTNSKTKKYGNQKQSLYPGLPSYYLTHVLFSATLHIGHFSVIKQKKKIRHFIKGHFNDVNIKLDFFLFLIGNKFLVKEPIPGGLRSCWFTSSHVQAAMLVTSAKRFGIFPYV